MAARQSLPRRKGAVATQSGAAVLQLPSSATGTAAPASAAAAMEEDRGTLAQPDKSDDDDSMSSLEGEEFPSESDEDDIDGPVHGEDEDDDNVFASLEDYSDMIAKDMDT
jgi:hypothetical protein